MDSNIRGPFYRRWTWIRQAIQNPNSPDYYYAKDLDFDWECDYGDFEDYILKHLGLPPPNQTYLNRIDQSLGWVAGNLRWASSKEMGNNHPGFNRIYKYKNKNYTLSQMADTFNINIHTLTRRLQRGWTIKEAVTLPLGTRIKGLKRNKN